MNALVVAPKATDWHRLKRLVLDSVSSPITRRVYNLGLDEFFAWYGQSLRLIDVLWRLTRRFFTPSLPFLFRLGERANFRLADQRAWRRRFSFRYRSASASASASLIAR